MMKSLMVSVLMVFSLMAFAEESPPTEKTVLEKVGVSQSIQDQVAVIIQKSITVAEKTGEFLVTEVPDVVKQFLTWKFWEAVIWTVTWSFLGLLLVGGGIYFFLKDFLNDFQGWGIFGALPVAFGGISLIGAVEYGMVALQIYIAPKVYLLEWAADHLKR